MFVIGVFRSSSARLSLLLRIIIVFLDSDHYLLLIILFLLYIFCSLSLVIFNVLTTPCALLYCDFAFSLAAVVIFYPDHYLFLSAFAIHFNVLTKPCALLYCDFAAVPCTAVLRCVCNRYVSFVLLTFVAVVIYLILFFFIFFTLIIILFLFFLFLFTFASHFKVLTKPSTLLYCDFASLLAAVVIFFTLIFIYFCPLVLFILMAYQNRVRCCTAIFLPPD